MAAEIAKDNVSVVIPLRAEMSSDMMLVSTPGALLSESNHLSYLKRIPFISSVLTAQVKFSPDTPKRVYSMPLNSPMPIQNRPKWPRLAFIGPM